MTTLRQFPCVASLLVAVFSCVSGGADVLRHKDGSLMFGRITSQSDLEIFFQERVDANNYIERRIPRDQVVAIVPTVDEQRLTALNPAEPLEYRALAEELAGWRVDPEAKTLAIRLYLIAARLTSGSDRRHALLALVELSRSTDERQRFGELAFLVDDALPRSILNPKPTPNGPQVLLAEIEELIRAVQAVRRGDGSSVEEIIQRPSSRIILDRASGICTLEQLQQAAAVRLHSLDELNLLIKLEIDLQNLFSGQPPMVADQSWYRQSQDNRIAQWELPNWSNVTEFDPADCVYRNGRWQAPLPEPK